MPIICPHCKEETKYVKYEKLIKEYGDYDLNGYDFTDSEEQEAYFYCPNCDRELDDQKIDDLFNEFEEKYPEVEPKFTAEQLNKKALKI